MKDIDSGNVGIRDGDVDDGMRVLLVQVIQMQILE